MKMYAQRVAIAVTLGIVGLFATVGLMTVLLAPNVDSFAMKSSADIASWVQAIGSVAAIVVAFRIGAKQASKAHESALELYRLDRKRIEEGCRAIVSQMLSESRSVSQAAQLRDAIWFRTDWATYLKPALENALGAFDHMPKHELGRHHSIRIAFEIRACLAQHVNALESLLRMWPEIQMAPPNHGWPDNSDEIRRESMKVLKGIALQGEKSMLDLYEKFEGTYSK